MSQEQEYNFDFDADDSVDTSTDEAGLTGYDEPEGLGEETGESLPNKKPSAGGGIVELIKANWLYAAIGVVGIAVVYYLVFDVIFPSAPTQHHVVRHHTQAQQPNFGLSLNTPLQEAHKHASTKAVQETKAQPQQSAGVGMSASDLQTIVSGFLSAVNKNQQALAKQIAAIDASSAKNQKHLVESNHKQNQKLDALEQQILILQKEMLAIGKSLDSYNKSMDNISKTLKKTQGQLSVLLAEKAQHAEKLTLRAVVPGRAWLVNGHGQTITVTNGSELQDFGKVTRIDSDADKVYMSSGYVFD